MLIALDPKTGELLGQVCEAVVLEPDTVCLLTCRGYRFVPRSSVRVELLP